MYMASPMPRSMRLLRSVDVVVFPNVRTGRILTHGCVKLDGRSQGGDIMRPDIFKDRMAAAPGDARAASRDLKPRMVT